MSPGVFNNQRPLPAAEIINTLMKSDGESGHPESIRPSVALLWDNN